MSRLGLIANNLLQTPAWVRGFGTHRMSPDAGGVEIISNALEVGYRHFDTAQLYGSEPSVGEAIANSDVAREELFICTKVLPANMASETLFLESVEQSLRELRVAQVDLLLLHWPPLAEDKRRLALEILAKTVDLGLTEHIGISNFTATMMREAVACLDRPLLCNQVEFHPLLDQQILQTAATETGMTLTAHCPLARGAVFAHSLLTEIGSKYGKDAAQVSLRWIMHQGVTPLVRSTKRERMATNFASLDFELTADEQAQITSLACGHRCITSKSWPAAPVWD